MTYVCIYMPKKNKKTKKHKKNKKKQNNQKLHQRRPQTVYSKQI